MLCGILIGFSRNITQLSVIICSHGWSSVPCGHVACKTGICFGQVFSKRIAAIMDFERRGFVNPTWWLCITFWHSSLPHKMPSLHAMQCVTQTGMRQAVFQECEMHFQNLTCVLINLSHKCIGT